MSNVNSLCLRAAVCVAWFQVVLVGMGADEQLCLM